MKRFNQHRSLALAGLTLLSFVALGGCSSEGTRPEAVMTQAKTVVDQADRAGARSYAAFDLNNAHSKLKKAEAEMALGKYNNARHLAKEAKVDAELALGKMQTAKRKEAEVQLDQSMQSLKNEVHSKENNAQ
jgi:hypothetical protein